MRIIISFLLTFIFIYVSGQEKGYYVKDSVYHSAYVKIFRDKCYIYSGEYKKNYIELLPSQIQEVGIIDQPAYYSKDVIIKGIKQRVFLEKFYSGKLDLYCLPSGLQFRFFIESDTIKFREEYGLSEKFLLHNFLKEFTYDCKYIQPDIEQVIPTKASITSFFKAYEKCRYNDNIIKELKKDPIAISYRELKTEFLKQLPKNVLLKTQVYTRKGYYIIGELRNLGYIRVYSYECRVYNNEESSEYYVYSPDIVDTIIVGNNKYVSKEIEIDNIKKKIFLELIYDGSYTLYKFHGNTSNTYFFIESDTIDFHLELNLTHEKALTQYLFSLTNDCPEISNRYEYVTSSESSLKDFFKKYDQCKGIKYMFPIIDESISENELVSSVNDDVMHKVKKKIMKDLSKGFVIDNNNDTIDAFVKKLNKKTYYQKCSFIRPDSNLLESVDADQIKGFIIKDNSVFRSRLVTVNGQRRNKFIKILVEGEITLYTYRDISVKKYVFEKNGEELLEINNRNLNKASQIDIEIMNEKQHVGKLKYFFKDKPELFQLIEKSDVIKKDFVNLVEMYNH